MAGRIGGEKTRCSGKWTEARYRSFVKGNLRRSTMKWSPINESLGDARTRRGFYRCAGCQEEVTASAKVGRVRKKNVHVDHINPIIDPDVGWVSWDETIERMFCEKENLQVLCTICHDIKTNDEKEKAKARRAKEKLNDE
jgi:5-methylcytosine-specific restriction endonuclease McrA